MGFREFITSRWFRRSIARDFERYQNIKPPANPSRRYIDKLVRRLLDERKAWDARKELSMIGAAAVPSLAAALADARYHAADWPKSSQVPAPLESVLELLVPHGGQHVLAAATPLVESPSNQVRKTAALQLASLGRGDTLPLLARLLQDADGYVRSYVVIGIERAVSAGRADEAFRRGAYDLVLAQCDQKWEGNVNDAADLVVKLDPQRAAADFASERWLSPANRYAFQILESCNEANLPLPEALTRRLLDHSLPQAVGPRCYPHQNIAAAALEALALSTGERARPLLEAAMGHEQEQVQEAAARGMLRLTGLGDPESYVFDRMKGMGPEALSPAQRVVYFAAVFDGEVCNGGIMQFFGNSSGDYASDTLDALRELAHPQAEAALATAMKLVGPLAREPDRDMRLAAFEERYDELMAAFGPLEGEYYRTKASLRQKWLLYACAHADQFRN